MHKAAHEVKQLQPDTVNNTEHIAAPDVKQLQPDTVNNTEYVAAPDVKQLQPDTVSNTVHVAAPDVRQLPWDTVNNTAHAAAPVQGNITVCKHSGVIDNFSYKQLDLSIFTINSNICSQSQRGSSNISFIIIVTTAVNRKPEVRQAIRDTWGSWTKDPRMRAAVVFLVGSPRPGLDPRLLEALTNESRQYGDVIMTEFVDDYRNMTLKSMAMLHWVQKFCPNARYVIKCDDDVFVNVPVLVRDFPAMDSAQIGMTMHGYLIDWGTPYRVPYHKWCVSERNFPHKYFPKYCNGPLYAFSSRLVAPLLRAAYLVTLIPIEDVFICGIVAEKAGIERKHHSEFEVFWYYSLNNNFCKFQNKTIGRLVQSPALKRQYWGKINSNIKCK
ncbi:beta-1,3-galactosyltransferase 5-like [Tubulanus polymorphus]|uniref:beta-1,3-galactosyltransferase 5-like n=1 Tax=Tubulanus polymorphus TaxID=672921 RepID=UPI003DA6522E